MLVLSRREDEKILLPDLQMSIQVIAIRSGVVRLGIEASPEARVLRDERGESEESRIKDEANIPADTLHQINQMLEKRLTLAQQGLAEIHRQLYSGKPEEVVTILDRVGEDLFMLQRRLQREVENTRRLRSE